MCRRLENGRVKGTMSEAPPRDQGENGARIRCPLSMALVDLGFWFGQGNWRAGWGVSELDD